MFDTKTEVRIYTVPWGAVTKIAFLQRRGGKVYAAQPVELTWKELQGYDSFDGTLSLPHEVATEFLTALSTALDDRGIKPANDHHIAGELAATKVHLDDMRNLTYMLMAPQDGSNA